MSSDDYRRALDTALREYERVTADRAALDQRIVQLQQTIGTLTRLYGFTPTVPLGLTDACRLVLRGSHAPMTAMQVRERLDAIGLVDLTRYANALSAIHTVLKRLHEAGEAWVVELDDSSRTAYQIRSSAPAAPGVVVVGHDARTNAPPSATPRPRLSRRANR